MNKIQPSKAQLASAINKVTLNEITELIQLMDSRNLYDNIDKRYIDKLIHKVDKANVANFLYTIERIQRDYHDYLLSVIYKSYNDTYDFRFNNNYASLDERHKAFNIILNNQYNINRVLGKIHELDLFEKQSLYNKVLSMNDEESIKLLNKYLSEAEIKKFKKE
jgi:hypothetical protein